jgi:DNA polymerase/3'-5' exonuclease PolX
LIFAIRTGSKDFSHQVLACGWVKAGYISEDGFLWRKGSNVEPCILVDVPEEKDLFNLIGVKYLEPEFR